MRVKRVVMVCYLVGNYKLVISTVKDLIIIRKRVRANVSSPGVRVSSGNRHLFRR